jgi:hypothetical protein
MQIITRSGWNAAAPKSPVVQTTWSRRTGFVVHHSGARDDQTVRSIQDYHMTSDQLTRGGWRDIGYNFLVDRDGKIYEGVGWLGIGAQVAGHNTATIGVCIIGDYSKSLPPTAALDSVARLYREANRRKGATLSIFSHRQLGATSCPGDALHGWVRAGLSGYTPPTTPKRPPAGRPAPTPHYSFPLPSGHYFGPRTGPNASVSGHYGRTFKGVRDHEWLKRWATQLQKRGWNARKGGRYLTRFGNDGKFGPEYESLVRAFQKDQRLKVTGRVDAATWRAAFENPVTG